MKRITSILVCGAVLLSSHVSVQAESFFEASVGVSQYALDIVSKRGPTYEDTSTGLIGTIAAYRQTSSRTAWGAAIEYTSPMGRDDDLFGSGKIIGFRVLNYLRDVGRGTSIELYAGAAQFDWERTANGYLFGLSFRYNLYRDKAGITLDSKYYQDLAYDNSLSGDEIVDGYHSSLKFFYRF